MGEIVALRPLNDVSLTTLEPSNSKPISSKYPSSRIQKGLVLQHGNRCLSEEGVGFGVPILKFGRETIFPGPGACSVRIKRHDDHTLIEADFVLNLMMRMSRNGRIIKSHGLYKTKEMLSFLHRSYPFLRKSLSFSSGLLREAFSLEDIFVEVTPVCAVKVNYKIKDCRIIVELRHFHFAGLDEEKSAEVVVMNEQGANYFNTYLDSEGRFLQKDEIGCWEEINAAAASFLSPAERISFTLKRAKAARMFRGRELAPGRLAWSGLAYVLSPETKRFTYSIDIASIGRT